MRDGHQLVVHMLLSDNDTIHEQLLPVFKFRLTLDRCERPLDSCWKRAG